MTPKEFEQQAVLRTPQDYLEEIKELHGEIEDWRSHSNTIAKRLKETTETLQSIAINFIVAGEYDKAMELLEVCKNNRVFF